MTPLRLSRFLLAFCTAGGLLLFAGCAHHEPREMTANQAEKLARRAFEAQADDDLKSYSVTTERLTDRPAWLVHFKRKYRADDRDSIVFHDYYSALIDFGAGQIVFR